MKYVRDDVVYQSDFTDDHEGAHLSDQMRDVEQRGAHEGLAREHQHLRVVGLHVHLLARHHQQRRNRLAVPVRVRAAAPAGRWKHEGIC